jgi:hypothetical protein
MLWPLSTDAEAGMKVLSTEKSKLLAEQNDWALDYARGFVDGETSRRLGTAPALYTLVGIDEYCLGFRAGYFERQNAEPATRVAARGNLDRPVEVATARAGRG